MIYVSSSCVRATTIRESVEQLAQHGFKNIELSGGTRYYEHILNDLLELKSKYGLSYLIHNYFPPPQEGFVLNLASLNDRIHQQSMEHAKRAIDLSVEIGSVAYGFHAGFFINIPENQIGKEISKQELFPADESVARFIESYQTTAYANRRVQLYIENNVLSEANYRSFGNTDPFMCTTAAGIQTLKEKIDFKFILDVAHLKVSARTLGLAFCTELATLLPQTDYIHISDNDGSKDNNETVMADSELMRELEHYDLKGKTLTLEIYDDLDAIQSAYELFQPLNHVG